MDKYTKFILTLIAILLVLHLIKPLFTPTNVTAKPEVVDVNIAKVGGQPIVRMGSGLPVFVTNVER